ncbi:STAS/SEC14 domain-containing protein [Metabacillus sediminilitoris]|uniref:STAS/SEC14 domain-containing protein n=1 Tax=Metabacillus sediminilitoris TaxID=2567941 RepID=A0A4S4C596_9BACI|nr:STAS/SEC14 domain-containing protein [Metabacillus sediminilitoris]QGQ45324.1 STAS/SEC14 domain-containing protein [Metabacillus sediminilitoris]THF82379.1 STAS/SEC14 domain-containing protein [Metabacillus sediminilitoris]
MLTTTLVYNNSKELIFISNVKNISTSVSDDIIITNLTGFITNTDVNLWYKAFEQSCQEFIKKGKKYKLLVNRKGYTPEHFTVQKLWKEKFFSAAILDNTIAAAFLMEEGDILNHLIQSNTKDNVIFSSNYDQIFEWISNYK